MKIQDAAGSIWLRNRLRAWLGIESAADVYIAGTLYTKEKLEELFQRVETLEQAYAQDPRRAEIAKEKAEAPQVMGGFTPRSKRIREWESQHRAQPKKD